MTWFTSIIPLLLISQLSCASTKKDDQALFKKWEAITEPAPGPVQPMGTYAAGCLTGATSINPDGPGYAVMRLSRKRFFGHPEMSVYLLALSDRLHSEKQPLLLIGDVSPPRGGPMRNGHNSHQIGLDADLWLRMSSVRPTTGQRESWSAPSFVIGRKKLAKSWSSKQTKLVTAAADFSEVNRVFVSPPIKRYFCKNFPKAPWLYKLRAWWGHEEHIHVRLNCPIDALTCQSQPPLNPNDNGCGAELDWWFSKEADEEWHKISTDPKPREFPELPASCAALAT